MKTAKPKESVIVLLDPDEFFLEPLSQGKKSRSELINDWPQDLQPLVTDVVKPGMAVAQMYGFGAVWRGKFDRVNMCGAESYCATINETEAKLYYPVGPPYLIHQSDFKPIMDLWWKFMKPTYAQDAGDLEADMYAYIMASAHLNVKHVTLQQYMVSSPDASGEGWNFVDNIKAMSCQNPAFPAGASRPTFIHAAHHYKACTKGDNVTHDDQCTEAGSEIWNFHKGHVPSVMFQCDQPLLVPPPDDLYNVQKGATNRRNAFMLCFLHRMVNDAVLDYKRKFCNGPTSYNADKCVRIALHGDGEYPLARRVCGKRVDKTA